MMESSDKELGIGEAALEQDVNLLAIDYSQSELLAIEPKCHRQHLSIRNEVLQLI